MSSEERFIAYLYRLASDERGESEAAPRARAALAALRRGRGKEPGMIPEMYPHIVPWLPPAESSRQGRWGEDCYFIIASLFAGHRWSRDYVFDQSPMNLGASFRAFVRDAERENRPVSESMGKRFGALLECDQRKLPNHLRYTVNLLNDIPIDWATLFSDIRWWDADKDAQLRWAKSFWYRLPAKPADDTETEQSGDDEEFDLPEEGD